jgi:hypothetical protein
MNAADKIRVWICSCKRKEIYLWPLICPSLGRVFVSNKMNHHHMYVYTFHACVFLHRVLYVFACILSIGEGDFLYPAER